MARHPISFYVLLFSILFLTGGHSVDEKRSYTKYLHDEQGTKILRLTVAYLGKEPRGQFKWQGDVDWKDADLDFYDIEWSNLTSKTIHFIKARTHAKYGLKRKTFRLLPDGKKEVEMVPSASTRIYSEKPREQGNALAPYETQTSENFFYGIAEGMETNTTYWEVTLRYMGREYRLEYHLIGTR